MCGTTVGWLVQTCHQAPEAGRLLTPPLKRPVREPSAVDPPLLLLSAMVRCTSNTTLPLSLLRFVYYIQFFPPLECFVVMGSKDNSGSGTLVLSWSYSRYPVLSSTCCGLNMALIQILTLYHHDKEQFNHNRPMFCIWLNNK